MAADKTRGTQTVRDMVLSLAVILLAAGVIYLFVPHDADQDPVKPVSYEVEVRTARRAAPYPVAAPEGLSPRWRATSERYEGSGADGAAWHLGFMAPGNEYAAVEQSDEPPGEYVEDVTQGARRTARTQLVDGASWRRYTGETYRALVRTEPGVTTVVTGTASFTQLAELAAALETGPGERPRQAGHDTGTEPGRDG